MLRDVTITSLLCSFIICYKTDAATGRLIHEWEHFCRNVMVSVGVSRMGKTNIIFIDPGTKVNSSNYCRFVLRKGLLPDIQANVANTNGYINRTQHIIPQIIWRKRRLISSSLTWPPNSPYLNPVDYAVWGALQQRVYHRRKFNTVEELKRAITTEWKKTVAMFYWQ